MSMSSDEERKMVMKKALSGRRSLFARLLSFVRKRKTVIKKQGPEKPEIGLLVTKEWIEATEFHVTHHLFEVVAAMVADGWRVPLSYNRLSLIVSTAVVLKDEVTILGLIGLLEASPLLQDLVVRTSFLRDYELLKRLRSDDDFSCCPHLCLKTIEIDCISGLEGQDNTLYAAIVLWLARILLERATALETMRIVVDHGGDYSEFVEILEQVNTYPRSSKQAQILILPDPPLP